MESKTYEKHKGDSQKWVPYIKGPEIIRRRASEIKVVEPFQKRKKKKEKTLLQRPAHAQRRKEGSRTREGTGR